MTEPEPRRAASEADAAARRRRRAVFRAHHPDLGGDPAELVRRLAMLDREATGSTAEPVTFEPVTFVRRPRGLRRLVVALRRSRRRRAGPPRVR